MFAERTLKKLRLTFIKFPCTNEELWVKTAISYVAVLVKTNGAIKIENTKCLYLSFEGLVAINIMSMDCLTLK